MLVDWGRGRWGPIKNVRNMNARILFSQRTTNRLKAAECLPELRKTNEVNTVRILSVIIMAFFSMYYELLCTVRT